MNTCVHYDERAPKRERWQVLRQIDDEIRTREDGTTTHGRWVLTESFSTERDAKAFAQGFCLGSQYAPPPEPIAGRISLALDLVKLARDDYKTECHKLRARLRDLESAERIAA